MEQNKNKAKAFPNYPNAVEAVLSAQSQLGKVFAKIDEVEAVNQYKVLCAFQNAGIAPVSYTHLTLPTIYSV